MAIEYNFNGKGKYDEERRATTYKVDSPTKNTVDNYDSVGYNENKKSTPTITPSTDFESQWKEKNQGLLKYAGDSAKKSVDKGLKEAPDYMKDADEGTSFENVQTASVKRNLAQDSNNDKLHHSALMEMIGHLSRDNKEPYFKHSQPLRKYIDTKDEFDFKHNNYTTTENVDKTPDENVRQLQRELNESGYTDKFGQKLKEDGIYAGKTAYADDSKKTDAENTSQRFGNRANLPSRGQTVRATGTDTYSTTNNNTTKNNNTKPNSKDDLSFDDYMKIGKYVYGDNFNPYILSLDITDDGMVATYPTTVNASGPMGPIYEPVVNILNNTDNIKVASVTGTGGKGVLESVDPKGNVRKYNEKIKENAKMNDKPEWNIRRASNIISKNSEAIKAAGKKYGVNPSIIAACIYTEQIVNYNIGDVVVDKMYWRNPSVGIGQVQIATAQSIEDKGLVEKTKYLGKMQDWHANGYVKKDAWQIPGYGVFLGTKEEAIAKRLNIDEQCIEYVGAYLKLIQDLWKDAYPIIDGKSDILATLYNMGEYGGSRGINSSPKPSPFGNTAKANYYHMQYLLGIE